MGDGRATHGSTPSAPHPTMLGLAPPGSRMACRARALVVGSAQSPRAASSVDLLLDDWGGLG